MPSPQARVRVNGAARPKKVRGQSAGFERPPILRPTLFSHRPTASTSYQYAEPSAIQYSFDLLSTISSSIISMAEAVGLAASIATLVGVALKVTKLFHEHFREAMNAQKDIERLVSEILSIVDLLEPHSTPAEATKISQTSDSGTISQLLQQCTEMLAHLQDELQHLSNTASKPDNKTQRFRNFMRSSKSSLKWPLKKEDIQERVQKIERLKTAVTLNLQMCATHILSLIRQC